VNSAGRDHPIVAIYLEFPYFHRKECAASLLEIGVVTLTACLVPRCSP